MVRPLHPTSAGRVERTFMPLFVRSLYVLILSLLPLSLAAQSRSDQPDSLSRITWRGGIQPFYGVVNHSTIFDIYYASPGCGQFVDQSSGLLSLSFLFEIPIRPAAIPLALHAEVALQDRSIDFAQNFSTQGRSPKGETTTIITQHRLDIPLSAVRFGLGLYAEPASLLRVGIVPAIVLQSMGDPYQYEQILSPLGATYAGTTSFERPVERGGPIAMRSALLEIGLRGGLRLPLGSTGLALLPELGIDIGLSEMEESYPWKTVTFGAGVGIVWEGRKETERPENTIPQPPIFAGNGTDDPVQPIDSIDDGLVATQPEVTPNEPIDTVPASPPVEKPYLRAYIEAFGIDEAGQLYADPVIEIRESPWTRSIPLVPDIFFAKGSSAIPLRYRQLAGREERDDFDIDDLTDAGPIEVHHQLLNILGERLVRRPEVSMTIVGTAVTDEVPDSLSQIELARARATSVREYLVNVWGIDPARLTISTGDPQNASSEETAEGRDENRRAQFRFDGEALLRPVVVERLARIASPPQLNFKPRIVRDSAIVSQSIIVTQGDRILLQDDSVGQSREPISRLWRLDQLRIDKDLSPFIYTYTVTDVTGQTASDSGQFQVVERVTRDPERDQNEEISEYLLAAFVYNSAELGPEHMAEIYEIAQSAQSGAQIEITGYTDRVGDSNRNRTLALNRAQGVATALQEARNKLHLPELSIRSVLGSGEIPEESYDNRLPEGRIFSRLVRVTVREIAE